MGALSLWREDGSVVYNSCLCSPEQQFSCPSPAGLMIKFYVSDSRLPQPGEPGPRIYIPQEQGGPVIPPSIGFPFCRLLRLAGLYGGGVRTSLPTGQSQQNYYSSLYNPGTDHTENISSYNACSLVAQYGFHLLPGGATTIGRRFLIWI
jgi:hypothetical protein